MTKVNDMMREQTATGGRWIDQTSLHAWSVARASERRVKSFDAARSKRA